MNALDTFLKFGGSLKINVPRELVDYANRVKAGLHPDTGHVLSATEKTAWLEKLSESGLA